MIALIAWILAIRTPDFVTEVGPGVLTATLFLAPAMALGELSGRLAQAPPAERLAYVVELCFRNLGLAIVVTVTLLRQERFLAFAAVFFVTAVVYALAAVAAFRLRWR